MESRTHVHEEYFEVDSATLFAALHTPSAIRTWWQAAAAIVVPEEGGRYLVSWGAEEDDPDYVVAASICAFEPGVRLVLGEHYYWAKGGPLPFEMKTKIEFVVRPLDSGAALRVTQGGFPAGPEADEYFNACVKGWRDTFAGIRSYLAACP